MPRTIKVPKELSKAVVDNKKATPKDKVEKKKAVPKAKVEKKKAVPKAKVEKKKAVPKDKVEKKKAVPKAKVEKKKAVPKAKVEKKKAVPNEKVEKKKVVPKAKVEKKPVPKENVEKKKVSPKVSKGGKVPYATLKLSAQVPVSAVSAVPKPIPEPVPKPASKPVQESIPELKPQPIFRFGDSIIITQPDIDLAMTEEILKEEIRIVKKEKDNSTLEIPYVKKPNKKPTKNIINDVVFESIFNENESTDNLNAVNYDEYMRYIESKKDQVKDILKFDSIRDMNRGINEGDEKIYYEKCKSFDYNKYIEEKIKALINVDPPIPGGRKNIKHLRKAKYGKKYTGGMPKLDKIVKMLKEKVKDTVFGITLEVKEDKKGELNKFVESYKGDLPNEQNRIINGIDNDGQKTIIKNFFDEVLKSGEPSEDKPVDNPVDKPVDNPALIAVVNAYRSKKIVELADDTEILTYKKKLDSISYPLKSIQYVEPYIFNKIYRPNEKFYVYGMQLPHQFDRVKLLGTMYKLHKADIYSIVDLQDCNSGINGGHPKITKGVGCNLYDRNCELDMWSFAITITDKSPPDNAKYYGIEYSDMSEGTFRTWNAISNIKNIIDRKNKLVVHCLAGAGRTGSVILYLLMRDSYLLVSKSKDNEVNTYIKELKEQMAKLYFGFDNIPKFIENFLLPYFTVADDDDLSDNRYFIKYMISELFELGENKDDIGRISLFRRRLNYIIVFLARHFDITEFVTYHHTDFGITNPDDLKYVSIKRENKIILYEINDEKQYHDLKIQFSNAYKVVITDWQEYDIDKILKGEIDKYDEVKNWIY